MENIIEILIAAFLIILVVLIYFAPAIKAYETKHKQKEAILILNLFLGWTTIGWVVALVWAYIKEK